ncbi:MAG: ADP-heptose synthase [Lentisphaerae bacterium]|nr:ADP-heptose synthase [Lentisphaerota bacterium]MBR2872411.1 adenylyltransferase/cytidyltransferase family protein [Lentisphaeria bacterium]
MREKNLTVAVTNGCFDLLHKGHAVYLDAARDEADALLVLVNSDESVRALKGPERPLQCEDDRAFLLCSLKAVDKAVIFNSPRCDRELEALAPDVYVKGGDYTVESLDPGERSALEKSNSKIVFISFVPGHSSTNIIRKMKS